MSLTADDPIRTGGHLDLPNDAWVNGHQRNGDEPLVEDDTIVVTCTACGTRQDAAGRAGGYTCRTCGSDWRVLRCRGCRQASVVLDGISECPRCGHENRTDRATASLPAWLTDPSPLSVWLGGVKYLGGHAERDQPIGSGGLLLDRRGIHLRAFSELLTIPWETVQSMKIEGPADISERITVSRLVALGATTWVTSVAYLTVHTAKGDAIFEIDGLGPPELRARLSRVLQGLDQRATPTATLAPITIQRNPLPSAPPPQAAAVQDRDEPTPLAIDPATADAPLDVLIVDALWKLAQLRDTGMLHPDEVAVLRSRLLARVAEDAGQDPGDGGPLLRV